MSHLSCPHFSSLLIVMGVDGIVLPEDIGIAGVDDCGAAATGAAGACCCGASAGAGAGGGMIGAYGGYGVEGDM